MAIDPERLKELFDILGGPSKKPKVTPLNKMAPPKKPMPASPASSMAPQQGLKTAAQAPAAPLASPRPAPVYSRRLPVFGLLFLAAGGARVIAPAINSSPPPESIRRRLRRTMLRWGWLTMEREPRPSAGLRTMPDDMKAGVRALLREYPDQRGYILDELRGEDWRVDGL